MEKLDKKELYELKEVLLGALEIADRYNVKLGPLCDSCKHNTILF